jgi:hypothetical protein
MVIPPLPHKSRKPLTRIRELFTRGRNPYIRIRGPFIRSRNPLTRFRGPFTCSRESLIRSRDPLIHPAALAPHPPSSRQPSSPQHAPTPLQG